MFKFADSFPLIFWVFQASAYRGFQSATNNRWILIKIPLEALLIRGQKQNYRDLITLINRLFN